MPAPAPCKKRKERGTLPNYLTTYNSRAKGGPPARGARNFSSGLLFQFLARNVVLSHTHPVLPYQRMGAGGLRQSDSLNDP